MEWAVELWRFQHDKITKGNREASGSEHLLLEEISDLDITKPQRAQTSVWHPGC